jgi:hypothetical protein
VTWLWSAAVCCGCWLLVVVGEGVGDLFMVHTKLHRVHRLSGYA